MNNGFDLIPSGMNAIDEALGGLLGNRLHVLAGPRGTDRFAFALQFLLAGLERGERCMAICGDDPEGMVFSAERLGFSLRPHLNSDKLQILKYRPQAASRLAAQADHSRLINELQSFFGPEGIRRLLFYPTEYMIDTSDPRSMGITLRHLLGTVDDLGLTAMLVVEMASPVDETPVYRELTLPAAGVFELTRSLQGLRELHLRKVWEESDHPLKYTLELFRGVGLVGSPLTFRTMVEHEGGGRESTPRILIVDSDLSGYDAFESLVTRSMVVEKVSTWEQGREKLQTGLYHLLIMGGGDRPRDAAQQCMRLREGGLAIPVVLLARRLSRASERAQILRLGADDLLERPFSPSELEAKVSALLRRPVRGYDFKGPRSLAAISQKEAKQLAEIPRFLEGVGLTTEQYFLESLKYQILKGIEGGYGFVIMGYTFNAEDNSTFLPKIVDMLWGITREDDMITQAGPSQFLLFLAECTKDDALSFHRRFATQLAAQLGDVPVFVKYSISAFPEEGEEVETLIRKARNFDQMDFLSAYRSGKDGDTQTF